MSIYFFFRYGLIAAAFIGWIFYQLGVKEKEWHEIKGDVLAIAFFLTVGGGVFYWLLS